MRKTLLIAAAALASSVISSQAQVYSQNIVGYANIPSPLVGKDYLVTCPFAIGVSNGVNEVFGSSLSTGTSLLFWSVSSASFSVTIYDPTDPDGMGPGAPVWYQGDDATPQAPLPECPPGLGFFIIPAGASTNTFAGTVAVNVGTSNVMTLSQVGKDYLVAPVVPYGGAVTNGNPATGAGGPNLNGLPVGTEFLIWSTASSSYTGVVFDNTDPDGMGPGAPNWYYGDDATPYVDPTTGGNVPNIAVGQGFYIIPSGSYNWTNGL